MTLWIVGLVALFLALFTRPGRLLLVAMYFSLVLGLALVLSVY